MMGWDVLKQSVRVLVQQWRLSLVTTLLFLLAALMAHQLGYGMTLLLMGLTPFLIKLPMWSVTLIAMIGPGVAMWLIALPFLAWLGVGWGKILIDDKEKRRWVFPLPGKACLRLFYP